MTDPNHIAEALIEVGRPQIREVFLRNGAKIEPDRDDLPDWVYESVFELLEMASPAVQGEPVAWQPVDELRFEYRHPKTGEAYTASLSREEVVERMDQELFEKLTACFCECEPIGETNVVDCRCDEHADQFELVAAPQPAEQQPEPDVAGLVEALEHVRYWIDRRVSAQGIVVTDALSKIDTALAAHRKQGGE